MKATHREVLEPSEPNAALVQTVVDLRTEIDGLRTSARLRAVIEQAKGILVERHGITLDEAFARLRQLSQEHNVRLVEVAATIVGVTVPTSGDGELAFADPVLRQRLPNSTAASPTWTALQQKPDIRDGVLAALLDAVAGSTRDGDEAASLLFELLSPFRVAGLILYRTALDGSLRVVGQLGLPGDFMSSWRSVPPSIDIPMVRAVTSDESMFWPDQQTRRERYPALQMLDSAYEAAAVVPVHDEDGVIGVVCLMWQDPEQFDEATIRTIERTVERVAPLVLRHVRATDPELDWLGTLLKLHLDPWILLDAVHASDGSVRDLVVQDVSMQVGQGTDWLGRRVLEIWPELALDGTANALTGLVRTGGSWTTTVAVGSKAPWGSPGSRVRAVRLGRRVVLVWRPRGT